MSELPLNKIINADCILGMKSLPDACIDCCVTSPPYFGLRDYGNDGQIGLEASPELFVAKMVEVFTEVHRILKPTGTLWLNLGDSYWGGKGKSGTQSPEQAHERNIAGKSLTSRAHQLGGSGYTRPTDKKHLEIKPKDLIGIPWMVAFALRSAGWYLRQDIIWSKPNPMPESVTDRCTKAHEYIFMLSKSSKYFYDNESIKTPAINPQDDIRRLQQQKQENRSEPTEMKNGLRSRLDKQRGHSRKHAGFNDRWDNISKDEQISMGANKRSVWNVATKPFSEAHFATFPPELIIDCIKAGCPDGGTVLDPFMGAGTTALVASKLNRNYIGFELNPEYIEIAEKRLYKELGMFKREAV